MATAQVASKPRRRWRQFGLRTLGLLVLLAALGMTIWRTLLAEHFLVRWIERQKGTATTEPALPDWLAWVPGSERCVHVTEVDLRRCRIGDAVLARFERLPKLSELLLWGSDVTLPAVEALVTKKPDLRCDLVFGDRLFRSCRGPGHFEDHIQSLALATSYKLAVAEFMPQSSELKLAALRRQLDRLQQLPPWSTRATELDELISDLVECECLLVRFRLATLTIDENERQRVAYKSPIVAERVVSQFDSHKHAPGVMLMLLALRQATEMRLACECDPQNIGQRTSILDWERSHLERLDQQVLASALFTRWPKDSGLEFNLSRLMRLSNLVRHAQLDREDTSTVRLMAQIPAWVERTRGSLDLEYETQGCSFGTWLTFEQIVRDSKVEFARSVGNTDAESTAWREYRQRLDDRTRRFIETDNSFFRFRGLHNWPLDFWFCAAMTAHMEDEGLPFFQHGFRAYLKKQMP